ncbi:SDR family NAD(P)-dependent oxidoreductase [Reinekea sp.]|jgi:benzil reductase ((S)-benzoin forming)|uniref:SDR family NAD(P)-dependent oxidoreductase n=1 Tax=Reinekea sp. TaxID=1970455 RepID=UPI003988E018
MKNLLILVGGSAGLGAALYDQFLELDYEIVEFSRSGNKQGHIDVDLSHKESAIDGIDQAFSQLSESSWKKVVLILNAAQISPIGDLSTSEPKQWWQHIEVNFTMPISIVGRFQTHFQALNCEKTIAFVSSGAATSVIEGWSLYSGSKAGVEHFMRVVAQEQSAQAYPINCAILNPGIMDTNMQATIRSASAEHFSNVEWFQQVHENGQLATPDAVAKNIVKLLSKPFESGQVFNVSA